MAQGIAQGGARIGYYYCKEAADGTIDASTPVFLPLRLTDRTLALSANELTSNELRPDRHRAVSRRGATTVGGDLTGELSFATFDDAFEAVFCSPWATNVLKTGTTRSSFAILKRYLDIGVDTIYRGCEFSQLKLTCPLQEKITVAFTVSGKTEESYTVPSGATLTAANTNDYMTTLDGSFSIGGTAFGCATAFDLTLNNNIEPKYNLFSKDAYAMKIGMIDVTGSLSAYIEDETLKTAFNNEADQVFSIVMTDKSSGGNTYTLALPRARFSSESADSFQGDDLGIQQFQYRALYDDTAATELSLTRSA